MVAQGEAQVWITDNKDNDYMRKRLRSSDYFGEISLIYGCSRTATVISSKYTTLGKLSKEAYKEVMIEFPDMEKDLKEGVF